MKSLNPICPSIGRRQFMQATGVGGLALGGLSRARTASTADRYAGLATDKYLGNVEVLTKVQARKVFTEGPAVDREGNVFFTNIPASQILKWSPAGKTLMVFRDKSNAANGLLFDPQGRLLACEGAAGRVTRTNMKTGKVEVLADKFNDRPLAPPNDLCLDSKGRIYFTSRPSQVTVPGSNVNSVYRIGPDGTIDQLLREPTIHMPNGIVLSPDEKTLYLIEAHPDADHHRDIRAYSLKADGTLGEGRVLINFYPGRSGDGMCIDAKGNLYVAAGLRALRGTSETLDTRPGIHVISPQGILLAYRKTPEDTITNCTFGGVDLRTLYVACGSLLLAIRTEISGKASYRPSRDPPTGTSS